MNEAEAAWWRWMRRYVDESLTTLLIGPETLSEWEQVREHWTKELRPRLAPEHLSFATEGDREELARACEEMVEWVRNANEWRQKQTVKRALDRLVVRA